MHLPPLILPALLALAAPPPWGLASVFLFWRRARPAGRCALGALAVAALLARGEDLSGPAAAAPTVRGAPAAAVRLTGVWRHPPGQRHGVVETTGGDVALEWAGAVARPVPGTPVQVLARVRQEDGRLLAVDVSSLGPPGPVWPETWRDVVRTRIRQLVAPDHVGLCEALVLGRREDLHFEVKARCLRTGTMHLLVLSGLHVGLVSSMIAALTGTVFRRQGVPCGLLLLLFVSLSGPRPPLVRALLGWVLDRVGAALGRRPAAYPRLASSALIMLAWNPLLAASLSFQLSFLAVAGMIAVGRIGQRWGAAWIAPVGAFLGTAPLCASTFGEIQPWGVLWTPLLAPFVAVILATSVIAVLPGSAAELLDPLTGPILDGALAGFESAVAVLAGLSPETLRPTQLPIPGVLLALALVGALVFLAREQDASPWENWIP